ncbi:MULTISPECIES: hypothetical protein [Corynebacterium]|uniref:Roadblock/LAMTOR2 domain-containing protein n=1 Tax=Corynebacterium pilosum TaxID=35756 RepID=A0A376CM72_9CORY|nr:hypothetical protein [Corynebacterium pilosum]STC69534.1 Uncharacterised protein [Corynebacterium pilosum]
MSQQEALNNMLQSIADNIDGFIGASVVDMTTGMAMASLSHQSDFDLDIAAAYNAEMVKAKVKTMQALNITSGLQDMLITLDDQFHLIRMLNEGEFVYAAVSSASTNLAMLRAVVNSNIKKLG